MYGNLRVSQRCPTRGTGLGPPKTKLTLLASNNYDEFCCDTLCHSFRATVPKKEQRMPRTTINISLSPEMRQFVMDDIKVSGYTSASEYFRELIRERRLQVRRERDLQDSLIEFRQKKARMELEGYRSPEKDASSAHRDIKGRFRRSY
jgi:Arc/MetJ-type ribon-helix-helix transcriptional regulator